MYSKKLLLGIALYSQFVFTQNQDINVTGNGNDIYNGGTNSPSLNNDTDFGDVELNSISQVTLTIENTHHGGNPNNNKLIVDYIDISGSNASDFVVTGISFPATINRNNSTTFIITFTPTQLGNENAIVSISSNDPDEDPYTFNLQGNGIAVGNDPSLTLTNTYSLSVAEPSGLTYDKANNQLLTVSDNTAQMYRLSLTGTVLQTYGYSGVDTEGVTFFTPNKVLITEERSRDLIEYYYVNNTFTTHNMSYANDTSGDQNKGIEGVSYDPASGTIFFTGEFPSVLVHSNSSFTVTDEYPLSYASDISASYFVEETGYLWLASDEESTIYKCNTDGTIVNSFPVTDASGNPMAQLEGIAIDHSNQLLYAVTDASEELYVFTINNDTNNNSNEITAVEDIYPTLDGINGETTSSSVLVNDTFNELPATLLEVSLTDLAILDPINNPTSNVVLNSDGTITVLANTSTGDYSLTYEICELAEPTNCSQVTNTISIQGPAPTTVDVVVAGDSWKYYDNENEPSGSWKSIGYDDSLWGTGNAVLGFNNGELTTLNSATITAYFRKNISISNASSITDIDLEAIRDDGMIVYINGQEVWRENMPTGNVSYTTQASSYIIGEDETTWINQNVSNNLVEGNNVVAVEIHVKIPKGRNKVPDMSFDFTMTTTSSPSNSTEINEFSFSAQKDVIIYPVPVDAILNINNEDDNVNLLEAAIYNRNGVLVKKSFNNTIDVSQLRSDIYFVIITTTNSTIKKMIIVDHK
jgi:uncharacterized protein YjiK